MAWWGDRWRNEGRDEVKRAPLRPWLVARLLERAAGPTPHDEAAMEWAQHFRFSTVSRPGGALAQDHPELNMEVKHGEERQLGSGSE